MMDARDKLDTHQFAATVQTFGAAIRSTAPAIYNISPVAIRMEQQSVLAVPRD